MALDGRRAERQTETHVDDYWASRLGCIAGLVSADGLAVVALRGGELCTYVQHNLVTEPRWEVNTGDGVIARAAIQRSAQIADVEVRLADGGCARYLCATPLLWRGIAVGAFVALRVGRPWIDRDQLVLGRAADLAVLELMGANELRDAQRAAENAERRLKRRAEIQADIAGAGRPEAIIERATTRLAEFFDASGASLMLVEGDGDLVVRSAVGLKADTLRGRKRRVGEGIAGWVAQHGEAVVLSGKVEDSRFSGVDPSIRGALVAPLRDEDRILGVINLNAYDGSLDGPERLAELTAIASDLGRAIAAAEAVLERNDRIRQLEEDQRRALAMLDVARLAAFGTDPSVDLDAAVDVLGDALRHEVVGIWIASANERTIRLRSARGYGEVLPGEVSIDSDAVLATVFRERRTQLVRATAYRSWVSLRARSYIVAPIAVGEQTMGVLVAGRLLGAYTAEDADFVSILADSLGGLVRKAVAVELVEQAQLAERRRIAREVQERFATQLAETVSVLETCQRLLERDPGLPTQLAKAAREGRELLAGIDGYIATLAPEQPLALAPVAEQCAS